MRMREREILWWLRGKDPGQLETLMDMADRVRARVMGNEVHLRALMEFSNVCGRSCTYCGLRAPNERLPRYRMPDGEILETVREAHGRGLGTILLQSGENLAEPAGALISVVREIRRSTDMAIALSLGERSFEDLERFRDAGASRYLLKIETSDDSLHHRIHPPRADRGPSRLRLLLHLERLGYQVASGIMVGIPGQTWASVARDLRLFAALDLDMIAVGPYIPHPETPLARVPLTSTTDQVPPTAESCLKVIALSRIVRPDAHIPATRAMAVSLPDGTRRSLQAGADVIMVNLTPPRYRAHYTPYPGGDAPSADVASVLGLLQSMGRVLGRGRGDRHE